MTWDEVLEEAVAELKEAAFREFNPNHDPATGRFSSGRGGGSAKLRKSGRAGKTAFPSAPRKSGGVPRDWWHI